MWRVFPFLEDQHDHRPFTTIGATCRKALGAGPISARQRSPVAAPASCWSTIPRWTSLQALRDRLGKPLIVRSAYRSPEHNRAVGGATRSKHLRRRGLRHRHVKPRSRCVRGGGTRCRLPWLRHLSSFRLHAHRPRPRAVLGRAVPGPRDFLRRGSAARARSAGREPNAERQRRGGCGNVGAAGVEVAQDVLANTQSAILPLVPYLDSLRWVFITVALFGIAVAIHARIDDWKRGQR